MVFELLCQGTLSVPPSTDRVFVGVNLTTAGSTHGVEDGHDQFEPSLSVLQVQYAGQTLPNTAYQSINKSATDRHVVKPYSDFLAACGKLYLEQSSYDNMEEWSNNPIQGLSFEKSPNDSSTSVIVRCLCWRVFSASQFHAEHDLFSVVGPERTSSEQKIIIKNLFS